MGDRRTIDYYNRNAASYAAGTRDTYVSRALEIFLPLVRQGGSILDMGSGSGRDSRFFLDQGFQVTAVDGSPSLAAIASTFLGQRVIVSDFLAYEPGESYDGIWAQASLLHLRKAEIRTMLRRMKGWLAEDGVIYLSFRYGEGAGYEGERYYTNLKEETLSALLEGTGLSLLSCWVSEDVRKDFSYRWLNAILRREDKCKKME